VRGGSRAVALTARPGHRYVVAVTASPDIGERFLALHVPGAPLLQPNAWDAGSARLLETLGFAAIATTSSGFAATLGRVDGAVTRDEVLDHCRSLVAAVGIPVAADLENGYADDPAGVAETVRLAAEIGLAGVSVEDYTRAADDIYDIPLAAERVAAAVDAARAAPYRLVVTARAENHIHKRPDLADTIRRLQAYQEAGADVLFAPGVVSADDVRTLLGAVDRPVNVLAMPACPPVAELAGLGVARVSVGGAFAFAAYAALVEAAQELRDDGTYGYLARIGTALPTIKGALSG
jgi:2-methylisocitrate lyase-like PEP mutase family enzyme